MQIQERYADQDEEDRQLAMQLLGSQGQKKTREQRKQERKEAQRAKRPTNLPAEIDRDTVLEAAAAAGLKVTRGDQEASRQWTAEEKARARPARPLPFVSTSRERGNPHRDFPQAQYAEEKRRAREAEQPVEQADSGGERRSLVSRRCRQ